MLFKHFYLQHRHLTSIAYVWEQWNDCSMRNRKRFRWQLNFLFRHELSTTVWFSKKSIPWPRTSHQNRSINSNRNISQSKHRWQRCHETLLNRDIPFHSNSIHSAALDRICKKTDWTKQTAARNSKRQKIVHVIVGRIKFSLVPLFASVVLVCRVYQIAQHKHGQTHSANSKRQRTYGIVRLGHRRLESKICYWTESEKK